MATRLTFDAQFSDIIQLIKQSHANAIKSVNAELINLYWNVGAYIKQKLLFAEWGDKTVNELSAFIQKNNPELKGFDRRGLYRMVQFYETYSTSSIAVPARQQVQRVDNQDGGIVSSLRTQFELQNIRNTILVQLSWTHHRTIFSRCKTAEEKQFYIKMSIKEAYTVRELDRQISSSLFERTMIGSAELSPQAKRMHTN